MLYGERSRRSAGFFLLLGAGGLVGLVTLLALSRRHDGNTLQVAVGEVRRLRALDARLDRAAVLSRYGLQPSYDVMVRLVAQSHETLGGLTDSVGAASLDRTVTDELGELAALLAQKESAVEGFKSSNAVLRNTVAYIPLAADQVVQAAPVPLVERRVDELVRAALVYDLDGSSQHRLAVEQASVRLTPLAPSLPPPAQAALVSLTAHVRILLYTREKVDDILAQLIPKHADSVYDRLDQTLQDEREQLLRRGARTRLLLVGVSSLLLAAAFVAFTQLRRFNASLESRVRERTDALSQANAGLTEKMEELNAARKSLAEASRSAGMAEVASTVLHNVGNVLNSVNVSTTLIVSQTRASKVARLRMLVQLVAANRDDLSAFFTSDSRGKVLPEYLDKLAGVLELEQTQTLKELTAVQKHVDHISAVIAAQQTHAKSGGVVETLVLGSLLDEVARCHDTIHERHGIELVREYADLPKLALDRHRVFQIVMNLLTNAVQATQEAAERRIVLRTRSEGDRRLVIEVADSGCGIPAENLRRIFNHGFTTKRTGHGFGLHGSACAAAEMGGRLTVASDGAGQGACFRLELPMTGERPVAATSRNQSNG